MNFYFLRLLLLVEFALSLCFLILCVWYIDSCWTIPCLSTDYQVNLLKSSVSQSVSSIVWGTCMLFCPLVALYLLYTRCRAFTGGVMCGSYMLVALAALLQAIAWGDSWTKLMSLVEEELLIFGSEYEINTEYRKSTRFMCLLAAAIAILDSITCLVLLCTRHQYCVDYYNVQRPQSSLANSAPSILYHSVESSVDDDDVREYERENGPHSRT